MKIGVILILVIVYLEILVYILDVIIITLYYHLGVLKISWMKLSDHYELNLTNVFDTRYPFNVNNIHVIACD